MSGPETLLDVRDLVVRAGAHPQASALVDAVSFTVAHGQIHGLVGESGSGKTMIANAVAGLLPAGLNATGAIRLLGDDLLAPDAPAARRLRTDRIGVVFQNPKAALNPRLTVGHHLREALRPDLRRDEPAALERALSLLAEVGIPDAYARLAAYPHELSGGLAQRVVIAMALARDPQLLIADEPTTALDMTIQAQILDLLGRIQSQRRFGVLLITHDMGVIHDRADVVTVLSQGAIVETGARADIFERPQSAATRALIEGALLEERGAAPEPADVPGPLAYSVQGARKTFVTRTARKADVRALDDVSLDVRQGRSLGIVGESGSGKTTLARVLLGLETLDTGRVSYGGTDIASMTRDARKRWRRSVQFVFQDPWSSLNPHQSIFDSIAEPLRAEGLSRQERAGRVLEVMREVSLPGHLASRHPAQLSGGQLQRAAIARALIVRPRILIADEPVASLDASIQARIIALLDRLRTDSGIDFIVISHDLRIVKRISHDVIVMKDGAIVERGPTAEVFADPKHEYTRQLFAATPGRARRGSAGSRSSGAPHPRHARVYDA